MIDPESQILLPHKNILYDIGDTLVSINQDFEEYTKRAIKNISPFFRQVHNLDEFIERAYSIRCDIRKRAHESLYEFSFNDFLVEIQKEYQLNTNDYSAVELAYVEAELEITILKEHVHHLLKLGLLKGKRQFVATNNFSSIHVKEILKRFDIEQYFEAIYISGELNVRKPSSEFINTICEQSELIKEETVIIGDKLKMDILGANNANIDSCWINLKEEKAKEIKPTFIIHSLKQINF